MIRVRRGDGAVLLKVVRKEGADGEITCKLSTETTKEFGEPAREFKDYMPIV
jgi:hypothetical protein